MGETKNKHDDNPIVFTGRFFREALRFDPKHSCRVVFLPDVDHAWVTLNIVPNFRAPYVLRLLESLIYLRSYTPAERVKYLHCAPSTSSSSSSSRSDSSSSKKRNRRDDELVMVTINTNKGTAVLHQNNNSPINHNKSLEPFLFTQPETKDHEKWRLMRVHKIIPDKNSNVDQDLWRLYELWLLLRAYNGEEELYETAGDDGDKACSSADQADDEEDGDEEEEGPYHKRACRRGFVYPRLHPHPHPHPHLHPHPDHVAAARDNTKCKRSPFPNRPQIRLLLEDDVYYLRKVDSVPIFDRFVGRADYGVEPPLPAVELQSLRQEKDSRNNRRKREKNRDKPRRAATVATGNDRRAIATLPGVPTPAPTPLLHMHRRRHHDQNQDVRYHPHGKQKRDQGCSRQVRQNEDRRYKPPSPSPVSRSRSPVSLSPLITNYGHEFNRSQCLQYDPQLVNEEATEQVKQVEQIESGVQEEEAMMIEQDEANSIKQEKKEAMIQREPFVLAGLTTTVSTQQPTTLTSAPARAATLVPYTFLPSTVNSTSSLLPPPVSLDAAYTIWTERNQQRARDEARRNLYSRYRDPSQFQDRAQREFEFLSPECRVFGVDLVNSRQSDSISPPTLSTLSSTFAPSLFLSQSQRQSRSPWSASSMSRWSGGSGGRAGATVGTATITRARVSSEQEKDSEAYDCTDELDMEGMTL